MLFEKRYPELFQLFVGYFSDADILGLDDKEAIRKYISDCNRSNKANKELNKAKMELIDLLDNVDRFLPAIGKEANRYFNSPSEAIDWLKMLNRELQNI